MSHNATSPALLSKIAASQRPQFVQEDGAEHLAKLGRERPVAFRNAFQLLRHRGFKPTSRSVHARLGDMRSVRTIALGQQQAQVPTGEMTIWEWDSGDPGLWAGQVYIYSYETGEVFLFVVQFRPTGDEDGEVEWGELVDYSGGWTYVEPTDRERGKIGLTSVSVAQAMNRRAVLSSAVGLEFGTMAAQVPHIGPYDRRRCLRECLGRKMSGWMKASGKAAGASLVTCIAAIGSGPGYLFCVGAGSLGSVLVNGLFTWVWEPTCNDVC